MDEYSNKRVTNAFGGSRESRGMQRCNRVGCSARHDSQVGTQIGKREDFRLSKPAFLSTSSRMGAGSTSKRSSSLKSHEKSQRTRRSTLLLHERDRADGSSRQPQKTNCDMPEKSDKLDVDATKVETQNPISSHEMEDDQSALLEETMLDMAVASRTHQLSPSSGIRGLRSRKMESSSGNVSSSSIGRSSVVTRCVNHTFRPSSKQVTNEQKHGPRNLSCTPKTDAVASGCSSSDFRQNRKMGGMRKRCPYGEDSATKCERTVQSSNRRNSDLSRNGSSTFPIPGQATAQPVSRARNQLSSGDRALSVRTRRSGLDSRTRFPEQSDGSLSSCEDLTILTSSQAQDSIDEAVPTNDGASASHHSLVDIDGYQHFIRGGIDEVLLALERIEQDEDLSYEQLMILQSNFLLGGLGFRDQHREWRMDIDNMSYEELLALEEKMGSVSTALSEEELSKFLRTSMYMPISESTTTCRARDTDDVKCSVCQEEYIVGDEISKLHCDHCYHTGCIRQWLRQKNWCPICKASACSS